MKKVFSIFAMAAAAISIVACTPSHEQTVANLKTAIDGESTASAKYAAFAERATQDSLPSIAALFQATAQAEAIHVKNHQAVLAELGVTDYVANVAEFAVDSTLANLQTAIAGEVYESETMYPEFIKVAEKEKVQSALVSYNYAVDAEKKHAALYGEAVATIATPEAFAVAFYLCPKCGNIYAGTPSEICEFCQTAADQYVVFNAVMPIVAVEEEAATAAPAK